MTFNLIAGAIIVACLIALAVVAARKFPQAALVDTDALPEEVAAKKKKEIIHDRIARAIEEWKRGAADAVRPVAERIRVWFFACFRRLLALERQLAKLSMSKEEIAARTARFLAEGQKLMGEGKAAEAERKFIEAMSLDTRNIPAYRGLGELYMASKQYEQARETFLFLVKVCIHEWCPGRRPAGWFMGGGAEGAAARVRDCRAEPSVRAEIAKNYVELGLACRASGQPSSARDAFENALAFEPSNPRYLDLLLDTCILEGAKKRAQEILAALKEVNPDNQKLQALAGRIASIPDERPRAAVRKRRAAPKVRMPS